MELAVFSEVSIAGGDTRVRLDTSTGDEEFDTEGGAFGFEIGPRVRWSHFYASLSYLHRGIAMEESDVENGVVTREFEAAFDAFAISIGGGF